MKFADTSFWYAYLVRRDRRHADAVALVRGGLGLVVTSNHVIGETWTLLARREGHAAAVAFLDHIARLPGVDTVHVEASVEDDAWQWLRRHNERKYSFVDATSFAVMRRRRIREALAFDGDFTAAGFIEVRANRG